MDKLTSQDLLLIFTYAPAGLGHLRVTDALFDGLSKDIHSVLLGTEDKRISNLHRLMSVNPVIRNIMEWFQKGWRLEWFTRVYVWTLRKTTKPLYRQLKYLINQQWEKKKVIVVVSTHFGLAHQIAQIKKRFEKEMVVKMILVVQVTDATCMSIWYVKGADIIFVPSQKVKDKFMEYSLERNLQKTKIEVLPYPINESLSKKLTDDEYQSRIKQLERGFSEKINIAMPISGAAVGLSYYEKLSHEFKKRSTRYELMFVTRRNIHTSLFIKRMKRRENIIIFDSETDRDVVNSYENLYKEKIIAFEVVKPSEQSFKALLSPKERGGSILLLTKPVGRQEEENLDFLLDHNLIPDLENQLSIWNEGLFGTIKEDAVRVIKEKARNWRAIRLTDDPVKDARIINWCLLVGIFKEMGKYTKDEKDPKVEELGADGVSQFWQKIESQIANIL